MKFWAMVFGGMIGLWLIVKVAQERFNGMAYWIGAMLLTLFAAIGHSSGFDHGAEGMEKGWIARGTDGKFYPTVDSPFIKEMISPLKSEGK